MTSSGVHPDWLVPQWPAPAHVHALCTTRAGGVSAPPYDSLNLGRAVGDDPASVARNRAVLQAAVGEGGGSMVFLNQVHGAQVLELGTLEDEAAGSLPADGEGNPLPPPNEQGFMSRMLEKVGL